MSVIYWSSFIVGLIFAILIYIAPILLTWGLTVKCDTDLVCSRNKTNTINAGSIILGTSLLFIIIALITGVSGFEFLQVDKILGKLGLCFKR